MSFTSDFQDRAQERIMIEAAIRDAHVQRADYIVSLVRGLTRWLTQSVDMKQVQLTRTNTGGLGHTTKLEVMS